ncbi:MAG: hypothetical protein Q4B30_06890 [Coriobacteriaceae bacterium]|nr:hypothetical protein [Coriobacteriaceae bacterium]
MGKEERGVRFFAAVSKTEAGDDFWWLARVTGGDEHGPLSVETVCLDVDDKLVEDRADFSAEYRELAPLSPRAAVGDILARPIQADLLADAEVSRELPQALWEASARGDRTAGTALADMFEDVESVPTWLGGDGEAAHTFGGTCPAPSSREGVNEVRMTR